MITHTPGPWKVALQDSSSYTSSPRGRLIVVDAKGLKVADCEADRMGGGLNFTRPYAENTANARLIAAAPELYEALKETLDYWETTGFADCEPDCDCLVQSVRAAIAKAEGQYEQSL